MRLMPMVALSALGTVSGLAATITWNGAGADSNWSSAANWSGVLPANGDSLIFSGATRLTNLNDWLASIGAVTFNTGGFNISGNALTLNGDFNSTGTNTWAINSTLGAARTFTNTDTSGTFTLSGSLTNAGFLTTIAGAGNTVISGVLGGSGGLAKSGGGTLTLSNANTYTGATTIAPGSTLSISQDSNLGTAPGAATAGSLVIDSTGTLATTATFTLNSNRGLKIGPTSGTGAGTLDVATGTILSYGGIITSNGASGTGGLTKAGAGTLVLSGANSYTGTTSINAGILKLGATAAIPSGTGNGNVVVDATLDLNGKSVTINGLSSIGASGVITSGVAGAITFTVGGNNQGGTYSGVIQNGSGTLALTKTGNGSITLGGNNTFTGGVIINGGALQLANTGALNSATPNSLTFGPGAAVGTKLQLNGTSVTVSSLATNATPGTVILENASASAATLTVSQSATTTFAGVIQNGGGGALGLTKSGSGTLILSGTNTYTGNTTITAGVLQAGSSLAIPAGAGTGNVVLNGGAAAAGTLDLHGFDLTINGLAGTTGTVLGTVVNNLTSTNKDFTVGSGDASSSFAGQILDHSTGTGTLNLIKAGSGTLTLSSTSSYSGATTIKNGMVSLGIANALPTTTSLTLGDGSNNASGILQLNGVTQALAGLGIAGTGTGNRIVNGSVTAVNLTLSVTASSSFSGSFGGPGTNENNLGLIKTGAGTLTLSGSSTYTGSTTISNGTLSVSNLAAGGNLGSAVTAVTLGDASNKGILSYGGTGDSFSRGFTLGAGGGEVDSTVSTKLLAISTGNITGSGLFSIGGAGDTSIASNLTHTGGLSKLGLGTLTLSGINSYTGATSILNGIIALGVNTTGLNAATTLTLGDSAANTNGVFKLNGFAQTLAGLAKTGNGTLNRVVGGSATLSNLTLSIGSTTSVNVVLGGSGSNENNLAFTKFGSGTLTFSATNTYTGGTILGDSTSGNNGILAVSSDANLGATGGVSIYWSTLELTSSFSFTRSLSFNHASTAIWVDAAQNFSTSGALTGSGTLNLTGPGTLTVGGTSNSWSGGTNVQNGTLALSAANALPTNTLVTLGAGTNSGILKLSGFSQTLGGLQISGSGSNKLVNGSVTAATLTIDNATPNTYDGVLGGAGTNENNFALTKSKAGMLTLTGANTYTGVTTIAAGILALSGGAAIADTGALTLADILGAGLQLNASETIGSLAGGGVTGGNVNLQSYVLTAGGNNTSTTFAGVISGISTGSLVKIGTGTLTLSNSNTFIGGVTINAGILQLASTGALNSTTPNSITFGASAAATTKLQLNGTSVTIGALNTNATPGAPVIENANALAATLTVSQATTTTFAGLLQDGSGGGALSFAKAGTGNLTIHNALAATYSGATSILNGVLTIGGGGGNTLPTGTIVTLGTASSATSGKLVLGDADNDNDDQTLAGLLIAGTGTTNTVAGGNLGRVSTLTLNIAGSNLFSGILGGVNATEKNLALVKTGNGTLTLSGTNTYTGTTTITGGILSIGADTHLGTAPASATAASIVINGSTLSTTATFTLASNRGLAVGPASGSGSGTLDVAAGTTLTYAGIIANNSSGTGGLTKSNTSGVLVLSGVNTYAGDTTIQGGTLQLGIVTAIPSGVGKGNLVLAAGSTLDINGFSPVLNGLTGSGTILNNGATGKTITIGTATNTSSSFSGTLQDGTGTLALTKAGTGVLTLTTANSYSGLTSISAGTLQVGNTAAIPSGTGKGNVSLTGALDLFGNSITVNGLSGAGGISSTIAGAVTLTVGANDATAVSNSYNGAITDGSGSISLTKVGTGVLTISASSTYSGNTTISAGTLKLNGNSAIPAGVLKGNLAIASGAFLDMNSKSQTINGLTGLGTITSGVAGALTLTAGNNAQTSTFDGVIQNGSGTIALTKTSTGVLTLTGINTYTGLTTVTTGTLALSGGSAIADTDAVSVAGTLLLNASETIGSLTGAGGVTLGGNTLTVGGDGTNPLAYTGIMTGTGGSLVKIGTGTYTPSGNNTYTGTTTIAAGTLIAANLAASKNLGNAASPVVLGDASTKGTLSYTGATASFTRGFTINAGGGEVDTTTAANTLSFDTGGVATSGIFTIGGIGKTTINSVISGAGSLFKTGAGALILSANGNSYTGAVSGTSGVGTIVNSGALVVTSTTGSTFGDTTNTNNVQVNAGGNLSLSHTLNKSASNQVIEVLPNAGIGFASPSLTQSALMGMFKDSTGGVGVLTIDTNFVLGTANYVSAIDLSTFAGSGGVGGSWFLGSATIGTYKPLLTTDLTPGASTYRLGGGGGTLTLDGPANLLADATSPAVVRNLQVGFSGANGGGTVVIKNGQSFSGTVSVVNTILSVSNLTSTGNLGTGTSAVTLGDGFTQGYLSYTGGIGTYIRGLVINAGGGRVDSTSNVLTIATGGITANGLLTIGGANSTTITSKITGVGGLTKVDAGTLTLSGSQNDYSGANNLNGGILVFSNLSDLGAGSSITLSGGTLRWGTNNTSDVTLTSGGSTRSFTLGASGGTLDTNGNNVNFSHVTAGAGTFTKTGTGILTLSAANNVMGAISVTGGTLQIGITGALSTTSNLSLSGGSTLDINGIDATVQSLASATATDTVINSASGTSKTLTVSSAGNTAIVGTIKDNAGSGGTLALTKSSGSTLTLGSVNTYSGVTTITNNLLIVPTLANINTASSIGKGSVAGSAADLVLNGGTLQYIGTTVQTTDRLFSIGTAATNALNASGTSTNTISFTSTGALGFAVDTTSNRTLTLTGTNTSNNSLAPVIGNPTTSGKVSISKTAAGTWVLAGANTYSGTTTVTLGTLKAGVASVAGVSGAFGLNSAVTMANAGSTTLDLNGFDIIIGSLTGGGATGGTITLGAKTLTIGSDNTSPAAYGGAISGTGGTIVKTGTGTLTLSSATSSYTGGTTISGGVISISADLNIGGAAGTLSIGAGTLLVSANIPSSTRAIALTDATAAISVNNTFSFTTAGAISGSALNLTGQGTLVVSGASNNYTGGTNIQNGTLQLGVNNALPIGTTVTLGLVANSGILKLNGQNQELANLAVSGSGGSNKVVGGNASSSTLTLNLPGTASFGGVLGGVGTNENNFGLTKSGAGTLTLTGTNTYTGATTISAGTLALSGGAALADTSAVSLANTPGATLLLNASETIGSLANGGTSGGNVNLQANTLTVGGDNTNTTYYGVISGSGGSLTKTGTGTLLLHTASGQTYTGTTTVLSGALQLGGGAGNILPTGTGVTLGTASSATAGKLILGDGDNDNDDQTLAGLLVAASNTGTNYVVGGNASRTSALTLNIATTNIYAGVLGGTTATENNLSLTKTGTGTLTLTGTSTYTGGTTIANGILSIGADANIGGAPGSATPNSIVINGGTLSTSATFTLTANRGISVGPNSGSGTGTLDVTAGTTLSYGGIIANNGSGTGGLTKTNTTGILLLSGSNTYSGDTTVQGGTLQLGIATAIPSGTGKGNVVLAAGSALDVANFSATVNGLSGTGTVSNSLAGACTFSAGANDATSSFGGVIQDGSGTLAFTKVGAGMLTLTTVQTYSGTTTLSVGTLKLGIANALPSGFGKGNLIVNGSLDLAGFAQTTNGLSGSGVVTNSSALSAVLTAGSQNTSSTFAGSIQDGAGAVALAKTGTGVLTLSGTNSYSGATTISAGTLQVGSLGGLSSNSTITIAAVGTLDVYGYNATMDGLLGTGTITNNGAAAVTLTAGSAGGTGSFDGVIQDGSKALALTKGGAGTLTLTGVNTYSGATTISNGTISVANPGAGGNLGTSSGAITLGDATHQGTLSYTGAADLSYTRGFIVNAGGGEIDGTAAGKTITLQTGAIATSGAFAVGGSGNAIIQSVISGGGGLTKSNSGTMLLAGANTYAGNTTISTGTLLVGAAADGSGNAPIPFGAGKGNVTVNGTLDVNNYNVTLNGLSGAGIITNSSSGTSRTLTVGAANGSGSFGGVIQNGAGSLALTKIGSGTIALANANSYSGDTTLSAGTLQVDNAAAIPSGANKGNLALAGTLDLHATSITVNGLSGAGTVTNSGSGAAVLSVGANDQTSAFGGNLADGTGSTGLTKTGTGILTLSGNNTFGGATTIAQGTLSMGSTSGLSSHSTLTIGNAGALDLNGQVITIDGLAGTGSITNNSSTPVSLTTGASGGSGTFGGTINDGSGVIALAKTGAGTVTLTHVNSYSGGTTVTGGLLGITSYGALGAIPGSPTPGNVVLNGGGISASNTFEIDSKRGIAVGPATGSGVGMLDAALNQTLTYNGVIANNGGGSGGLTKTGSGTVTLGGVNTYTGDTTIAAGALQIGNALAIPSGSGMGNTVVNATLDLNNTSITVNGLSGAGLVSNTKAGAATLSAGANNQTSTFGGVIENGNGTTALAKLGSGTLTLSGSNSYTGGTTIAAGTLAVAADGNLGAAPNTITPGNIAINAGATLSATSTFTLAANRGIAVGPSGAGSIDVAPTQTLTYGGAIANNGGSGGFTKTGGGTLVLAGTSSYTGTTTVTAGILTVNGSAAGSVSGFVRSGATLTGTGTTGAMTIDALGTVAPGNSGIGALGAAGGLTLHGNADFELGTPGANHAAPGASDRMNVTGGIALGGSLNLTDNAGANSQGALGAGSYKLFTYTDAASGSFASINGLPTYHWALHDVAADKAIYIDLYNYAVATVTPAVDLGRIHADGTFGTQALSVGNTTAAGNYTEALAGVIGSTASGITATGSVTGIAGQAGNSNNMVVGISDNSAGQKSGAVGVDFTSQAVSNSGLGDTALARQNVTVTGFAYSGQSVWNTAGSGSWGNNATAYGNWTHDGGVAGLDGSLSAADTATFGNATAAPTTVRLDGANPTLKAITFDHSYAYTLAQGSGGQLTLNGNGSAAAVTDASGSHTISAPLALASNAGVAVTHTNDTLAISGAISGTGTGLIKSGDGILALIGHSGYTGATVVSAGTLLVNGSLGNTATTIASGATLCGSGTLGGSVNINGTLAPGEINSIGTIGVDSLYLAHTLLIEWNGATDTIDRVNITGGLQLGDSATIVFTGMEGSLTQAAYVFGSYGSRTGPVTQFSTITDLPTGYTIDYTYGTQNNQLALVAIPEPRAILLGGLGLLLLLNRRRALRRSEPGA